MPRLRFDLLVAESDEPTDFFDPEANVGETKLEVCLAPSTHLGCEGYTCEKHKCRYAKPIRGMRPE